MSVPDNATLQGLIDDAAALGFMSGTDNAIRLAAYEIAWDMSEYALGTNILATGVDCEIHDRPTGWMDASEPFTMIELNRTDLVSVSTVTLTHDQFACDCDDEDVSACVHIYNQTYGHVRLENCMGPGNCACSTAGRPVKAEICYTSGKWGNVADLPQTITMALALIATWWSEVMTSGGALASSGFVDSWRSMDYSESLGFITKNVIGQDPRLAAAWNLIRRWRTLRAISMRSYYPTQPPWQRFGSGL